MIINDDLMKDDHEKFHHIIYLMTMTSYVIKNMMTFLVMCGHDL